MKNIPGKYLIIAKQQWKTYRMMIHCGIAGRGFHTVLHIFPMAIYLKAADAFNNAFEYSKKSGNIYLISTIAIRMAENEQQLGPL